MCGSKRKRENVGSLFYLLAFECCFFLAKVTENKVALKMAAAMNASAGLLNSGTFGVAVGVAVVGVPVLEVAVAVGLEPLDGSLTTAMLPMLPVIDPGLLIA